MEVKNPFSLYDFLGYLFPGALALFIIYTICKVNMEVRTIMPFDYVDGFVDFLRDDNKKVDIAKVLIPFLIVSYMFGHLFAYLSSLTIEYFTNRIFGYPSKYLLGVDDGEKLYRRFWKNDSAHPCVKYLFLIVLFLILLPIIIFVFLIRLIRDFVTRPLDAFLIRNINKKVNDLNQELKMEVVDDSERRQEFHRLVMHYVYLNIHESKGKSDNYLALYGYLRATTFIMVLFTDWLFLVGMISIRANWGNEIDLASLIFFLSCWIISFVSYMGFVKFYRRFTLENLMTLLAGKWHEGCEG